MFTAKLISIGIAVSFASVFIMNYLQDKPSLIKIFQTSVIISIISGLYILGAGIFLLTGWEDPFINASAKEIGQASSRAGGKGGIVILIIKYWPYAMIAWALYSLYYLRYWFQDAFR